MVSLIDGHLAFLAALAMCLDRAFPGCVLGIQQTRRGAVRSVLVARASYWVDRLAFGERLGTPRREPTVRRGFVRRRHVAFDGSESLLADVSAGDRFEQSSGVG